jgi:hypothetical protein
MLQKAAFTMYPVKDMAGARAFYEEVLGLGPSRSGATSPGSNSTCLAAAVSRSPR